jgi:hypothetical protein
MDSQSTLAQLEELLVEHIPHRIKEEEIKEPIYCLHVWCYGLARMPGDYTPTLTLKPESLRRTILAEKGDLAPHYLYCAHEARREAGADINIDFESDTITQLVEGWFAQLPKRKFPMDEDVLPLHDCIKRVAATLNQLYWTPFTPVTDDFVVLPADGSHSVGGDYQGWEDGRVPADKIALLQARRYIGRKNWLELE